MEDPYLPLLLYFNHYSLVCFTNIYLRFILDLEDLLWICTWLVHWRLSISAQRESRGHRTQRLWPEGLHRRRGFAIAFGGWIRCEGSSTRRKDMKKGNSWTKAQGWPPSSWDSLSHDNKSGALYWWPHFFSLYPLASSTSEFLPSMQSPSFPMWLFFRRLNEAQTTVCLFWD